MNLLTLPQRIVNYYYHGLLRNPPGAEDAVEQINETQVAITRSSVVFAVISAFNGLVYLSPLAAEARLSIMGFFSPVLGIIGALIYAELDKWLLATPRRQRE